MKNVAGYDVSRLAVGSLGTLGPIVEVSLKVLPVPVARATLRFALAEAEAIAKLNAWGGRPMPVSASAWQDGTLMLRLEGAAAAVDSSCAKLGGARVDEDEAAGFWQGVREQSALFFNGADPLWRVSVPSVAAPLGLEGRQLIEWGGALRWWRTGAGATEVRAAAKSAGGHATLFRGGARAGGVFTPLDPVLARLHRNVKAVFDPAGVFNRGRMYPEW
jgi:glycolate oxidase FAD binding subunit